MMKRDGNIYQQLATARAENKKLLSVLLDPDKQDPKDCKEFARLAVDAGADVIFMGGSLLMQDNTRESINSIRASVDIPVILYPGNPLQICDVADAILFLSLISGRNPELLIGQHVISAPLLMQTKLEVIPTGYMLIESGKPTSVSYISNTTPIPANKADIAACTAMAGQLLGLKTILMDAGSGASNPISTKMISQVRKYIQIPLMIGGGIRTPELAHEACAAGADLVIVGNALEGNPDGIKEFVKAVKA